MSKRKFLSACRSFAGVWAGEVRTAGVTQLMSLPPAGLIMDDGRLLTRARRESRILRSCAECFLETASCCRFRYCCRSSISSSPPPASPPQ